MKYCQLIIIFIFLFQTNLFSIEWEYIGGPSWGGTYEIEKDSKGNLYIASENGIWKSTDKGDSWFQIYNHIMFIKDKIPKNFDNLSLCPSIAIDSKDRIYAVNWRAVSTAYFSNIVISVDGGVSWKDINGKWFEDISPLDMPYPKNVEVDENDNVYLTLIYKDYIIIQKSSDQGKNWEVFNTNDKFNDLNLYEFRIKTNHYFLLGSNKKPNQNQGIIYSLTLNDSIWKKFGTPYFISGIEELSKSEYIIADNINIYKTTDDGDTWKTIENNFAGITSICFVSGNEIYVVDYNNQYYKSTDKGETFSQINLIFDKQIRFPVKLKIMVDEEGSYYSLGLPGITKSTDKGKTWNKSTNGFTAGYINYMTTDKEDNLLVGTAGAYKYNIKEKKWDYLYFPEQNVQSIYYGPDDNIYLSGLFGYYMGSFFRSTDNGESFEQFSEGLGDTTVVHFYDIKLSQNGILYGGSEFGSIYYSTDKGETWYSKYAHGGSTAIGINSQDYVFISRDVNIILRSKDGIEEWELVFYSTSHGYGDATSIEFHKTQPVGYVVSSLFEVQKTIDNGETWFSPDLELIDEDNNWVVMKDMGLDSLGNFIAVGYNGIWRTTNLGQKWERIDSGMQHTYFNRVEVSPSGYIYVAAEYGGVYRSKQRFVAVPELTPSSSPLQNYPNPFAGTTEITYTIPDDSFVHLSIYDILGIEVQELVSDWQSAGTHKIKYDGANLPSGIYFIKLEAGGFVQFSKMCHTL